MNFNFLRGSREPRIRDGGRRFGLRVILPRGILDGGRFLPTCLGLSRRFSFLDRCGGRGRFARGFEWCGGHREGRRRLGNVRRGNSRWLFSVSVEQSLKFKWMVEIAMEMTNTHLAICAHESLEVAGVLTLGRTGGIGCDLTEGEAAAEPLAVEVAPQADSVLLPHVPA